VLSRKECQRLFEAMEGTARLMAELMYGSGLRVMELLRLRVKDVDLARLQVIVRAGKGDNYAKVVVMQRCHAVGTNLHPTATGICGASESTNALRLRPDLGLAMPE
jgi:site-specific recombinase XerD